MRDMTPPSATSVRRFAYRNGNPALECGGAHLRAQCRQLASIVTVDGAIDEANVDRLGQYAKRFILAEKPFILDLSDVRAFSQQALALLQTVEQTCRATGVEWCLVAGDPVYRMLRTRGSDTAVASADSVPEALDHFRDDVVARRRLLPLLNKTA